MAELLAELVAKITADATELKKALAESEKDIEGTGKVLEKETKSWQEQFKAVGKLALAMGASITAAMTGAIMSFTKTGSELHDLSLKTGFSVKSLAGLKYAAEQNGATMGTVELAIRRTASVLQDVRDGSVEATRAFSRMGISIEDLEGLNPEQQFLLIATSIAGIPDPMTRAATAVDIFGRSGTEMLPMLSEGADGLRRMMEEGVKLTGWTKEGANSADALGDAFTTLKASTMGVFGAIGIALAPALKSLIDIIVPLISKVAEWTKEHPELTKQIGLLAIAVGGFLTLAGTLMLLAPMIAAAWTIAMGPVGLIVLAIAALIAIGILLWQNWDTIKTKAIEIWGAITDFFKDTWDKIVGFFKEHWDKILAILFPAVGLPLLIARHWDEIKDYVRRLWDSITGIIGDWWENIKNFFARMNPWEWIKEGWNKLRDGIKNVLKGIFGGSDIEGWVSGLKGYLSNVDLKSAGEQMFGTLQAGIMGKLLNITESVKAGLASVSEAIQYPEGVTVGGAFYPGGVEQAKYEAAWGKYWMTPEYLASVAAIGGEETVRQFTLRGYQTGGIVENTGLAFLHEGETVIPAGKGEGIIINFTQPVFLDREDTMNRFVDMIRKGIQRQDRLRFGGAYSGGA